MVICTPISDAELDESVNIVMDMMCQYAVDSQTVVRSNGELLASDLATWSTLLQNVVDEPFRLSIVAGVCSSVLIIDILNLTSQSSLGVNTPTMQLAIDGIDVLLRYENFHQHFLQTVSSQFHLLRNVSSLLLFYCNVVTGTNTTLTVLGEPSYSSNLDGRLHVAAANFSPLGYDDDTSEVSVLFNDVNLEFEISREGGPYCLVSYSAANLGDRMDELLSTDFFFIVPMNATHNSNASSLPQYEYFVVDMNPIEDENPMDKDFVDMFNVSCLGDGNSTDVMCLNYTQYKVHCSADAAIWNFYCPSASSVDLRCSRASSPGNNNTEICHVDYTLNGSVACKCRKYLQLNHGNEVVVVEFKAVFTYVFYDITSTLYSVRAISIKDMKHGARDIALLLVVIGLFTVLVIYMDHLAARQAQEALVGRKRNLLPLKKIKQADTEEEDFATRFSDIEGMFPEFFRDDDFYQLFITEIKKSHRWISLCFNYDPEYPRHLRFFFLLSVVNCMFFLNTVMFNWVQLDAEICKQFHSVATCLSQPSKFSSEGPMCHWDGEEASAGDEAEFSHCFPSHPLNREEWVLTVAAISALLSIPVVLLLEIIVVHLLCKPVLIPSQVVPISMIHDQFNESVERRHVDGKMINKVKVRERREWLHEVTLDMRQLVFDLQEYRKKLLPKDLPMFDARWGLTELDIAELLKEINSHPYMPLNSAYELSDDVSVDRKSALATAVSWLSSTVTHQRSVPSFKKSQFRALWNDLMEVRLKAETELALFELIQSKDLKGDRMLMLFKDDLLQGILSDVISKQYIPRFVHRTSAVLNRLYHYHRFSFSRGRQLLGYVLLALLNAIFLLYIFLFTLRQNDLGYRNDWLRGFLFWLALEVTFLSTLSMVMAHLAPLLLSFNGVREMQDIVISAVTTVLADKNQVSPLTFPASRHTIRRNSAGEVLRDADRPIAVQPVVACEEPFDISPYFFVSRKVAATFPDLIESKIIKQYRSVVPNRPYSRPYWGMESERVKLRWVACVQSTSTLFVYCLSAIVMAIPELEYYLSSVVGWLMLGYLSQIEGFTVLGLPIKFNGYFFLIFVVIFYITLFFIGKKILTLLRKEYNVGRSALLSKEEIRLKINKSKLQKVSKRIGKLKMDELRKFNLKSIAPVNMKNDAEDQKTQEQDNQKTKLEPIVENISMDRSVTNIFSRLNSDSEESKEGSSDAESSADSNSVFDESGNEDEKKTLVKPTRMFMSFIGSDSSDSSDYDLASVRESSMCKNFEKFDVPSALKYLETRGVHFLSDARTEVVLAVATAVRAHLLVLNQKSPENDSDSDSDLNTDGGIGQADILDAFSFLNEKRISLDDEVDMSLYVIIANVLRPL